MKLITKNTDYAVRALLHLSQEPAQYRSSREIAKQNNIPLMYMRRILQTLTQGGIVESREGVNGGVRLIPSPKNIKLLDVIRLFQGEVIVSECLFRKKRCENTRHCVLRKQLKRIEQQVSEEFAKISLRDLILNIKKSRD